MCQIMEDIRREGWEEGFREGWEEGRQKGLPIFIRNLMDSLHISIQETMKALGVPENEWEKYTKLLQQ